MGVVKRKSSMITQKEAVERDRQRLLDLGIEFDPSAFEIPRDWTLEHLDARRNAMLVIRQQLAERSVPNYLAEDISRRAIGSTLRKVGIESRYPVTGEAVRQRIERVFSKLEVVRENTPIGG